MNKGNHLIADVHNMSSDVLVDDKLLLQTIVNAANEAGANIINQSRYRFGHNSSPGCTAFIMLDESHVSIHTYADDGKMALDVFTCGPTSCEKILESICRQLNIMEDDIVVNKVPRF
ncbi:MAG TPA: adenosylmethionine decarboxylase [Anaerolineae bacterium]|jgi:S-adenosylmethionine decarboxylase proenzyme|nr:adenosylmethionine decarboxylase [Anaerolineae bacterium]